MKNIEKITLFFILGSGVFTFIWFLFNWMSIPYNLFSGFTILTILLISFWIIGKPTLKLNLDYFKNLNMVEKIILSLIIFMCLSAFIQTIYWPIRYWDSMVLYDFRAHVFAESGYMDSAIAKGQFFGYPLLTSLVHTFIYLINIKNPLFYYSFLYIALIILFLVNIKKFNLSRQTTLFLTLLVALSPRLFDHTQWGYTNLPYTIYRIFGSIYLYWGIKNKNLGMYLISAVSVGLTTWTRTAEPFWLTYIIVSVIGSLIIKKWFWSFFYTIIVASIMLPWRYYQSLFNAADVNVVGQVVATSASVFDGLRSSVVWPVLTFLVANVIYVYLGYFFLLLAIIIVKISNKSKNWLFLLMLILNLGLTFGGTIIFARYTSYWIEIPDSLSRMVMFIPVMVLFLAGELLSETKKWKQS